jgi:hypothetical protein
MRVQEVRHIEAGPVIECIERQGQGMDFHASHTGDGDESAEPGEPPVSVRASQGAALDL